MTATIAALKIDCSSESAILFAIAGALVCHMVGIVLLSVLCPFSFLLIFDFFSISLNCIFIELTHSQATTNQLSVS